MPTRGFADRTTAIAAPASSSKAPSEGSRTLTLQRTAGNRAVGRMLDRRAAPRRRLARYEPGEHVQFGTSGRSVPLGGLSGGDERYLIAMADFYEDPDALLHAKQDELKELMALIDRDERARTGKGGTSPSEDDWQAWSEKWRPKDQRYMDLNKRNESHFAPRNKARWEKLHREALDEATSAK